MRLAVVGSRTFDDYEKAWAWLRHVLRGRERSSTIVSGGAKGADAMGERYAEMNKMDFKLFPADWDGLGKRAGFIRNLQIVEDSDMILAFWDGKSKGTKHTIDMAIEAGKPVIIVPF